MELYVMRHGESLNNADRLFSGWSQCPLTEKGEQDALLTRKQLEDFHFDRIYSSDLLRSLQTARIAIPGYEPECSPLLREVNVGWLSDTDREAFKEQYGHDTYEQLILGRDFTSYGGENSEMFFERVSEFMRLAESFGDDERVAVFCHDGVIKNILRYVFGAAFPFSAASLNNGSVNVFKYTKGRWILLHWNLSPINDKTDPLAYL